MEAEVAIQQQILQAEIRENMRIERVKKGIRDLGRSDFVRLIERMFFAPSEVKREYQCAICLEGLLL